MNSFHSSFNECQSLFLRRKLTSHVCCFVSSSRLSFHLHLVFSSDRMKRQTSIQTQRFYFVLGKKCERQAIFFCKNKLTKCWIRKRKHFFLWIMISIEITEKWVNYLCWRSRTHQFFSLSCHSTSTKLTIRSLFHSSVNSITKIKTNGNQFCCYLKMPSGLK